MATITPALKKSLSRRFSLALIGVVTVILLFFSGIVIWYNLEKKEAELQRQQEMALKLAETSLPEAVWQLDHRSINDILRAILTNDAIMYARVLVEENVVASQVKPGEEGKTLDDYRKCLVVSRQQRGNQPGWFPGRQPAAGHVEGRDLSGNCLRHPDRHRPSDHAHRRHSDHLHSHPPPLYFQAAGHAGKIGKAGRRRQSGDARSTSARATRSERSPPPSR